MVKSVQAEIQVSKVRRFADVARMTPDGRTHDIAPGSHEIGPRNSVIGTLPLTPIQTLMDDMNKRNVSVFSSSNGVEVAGKLLSMIFRDAYLRNLSLVSGFYQHGGVSVSTFIGWIREVCFVPEEWALYPCQIGNNRAVGGPPLDSESGDEIQPGRYVIRGPPPGESST
jgi:hypothetical protein